METDMADLTPCEPVKPRTPCGKDMILFSCHYGPSLNGEFPCQPERKEKPRSSKLILIKYIDFKLSDYNPGIWEK